jgi:hypothetical protein
MTLHLPEPVAAYFAADKLDGVAISRCFTEDAVVKDEDTRTKGVPPSSIGRQRRRPSTNTRASHLLANRWARSTSPPAGSPATSPAAPLICVSSLFSKATRSRHWKSSRESVSRYATFIESSELGSRVRLDRTSGIPS